MSDEVAKPGYFLSNRRGTAVARRTSGVVGDVIGAFESDTVAVFVRTAPVSEHITLYIFSTLIILAIVFSYFVRLDRVVSSQEGWVVPTAGSIYVSPFDLGIVKELNVKVGDVVKKGQSLATLDPTFTQADLDQLRAHMNSDVAQIAREKAELARQPYVYSKTDHYQSIQGELWIQRQGEFKSSVENFQSQIRSTEAQLGQARSDVEKYTTRLKIAKDVEGIYKPLVDKGYASNLQLLQSTDSATEINRLLFDAKNQSEQYAQSAAALRAQLAAYITTWDAATSTQLVLDENDRDVTQDNLDKAQKMRDLTSLDAPEDGIVTQVGQVSKGSVQAGAAGTTSSLQTPPLVTLTPINRPLETELDINTQDIGFIRVGDTATLKIDAFPYIRFGTVRAVVTRISESSYATDINGQPEMAGPFFKVFVTAKEYQLRNVPKDYRLVPGMSLTGDILVGTRTIWSYMTEGAMRTGLESMREP
jgi:HlyD family type I secretion membrane fusion protein